MTIFGTRPELIKLAPIIKQIEEESSNFHSIVVNTAQHRSMLDQVLKIFKITPNYDLNIMKDRQTLSDITVNVLINLSCVFSKESPDIVLVHGDTTTTFVSALVSFYNKIKIGHVEAGLRTWNKYSPFPEEMNRKLTDDLSDFYFVPTMQNKKNLLLENRSEKNIFITGNTAIDALKYTIKSNYRNIFLESIKNKKLILLTMHRRENIGIPMENVFRAINRLVAKNENIEVVFPVHKNSEIRQIAQKILKKSSRLHLIEPLNVVDFHNYLKNSYLVISDSGGIQEEATYLGVPVLILRDTTERPEGVEQGNLKLIGTCEKKVYAAASKLINITQLRDEMAKPSYIYGNGHASKKILDSILNFF